MWDFYQQVRDFTADVKTKLNDTDLIPTRAQPTAKKIVNMLEMVGLGHPNHKILYPALKKHFARRGGAVSFQNITDFITKYGKYILDAYNWLKTNADPIHFLLTSLDVLQPYGEQVSGALKMVGIVPKPPKTDTTGQGMPKCRCRGGASDYPRSVGSGYLEDAYGAMQKSLSQFPMKSSYTKQAAIQNMDGHPTEQQMAEMEETMAQKRKYSKDSGSPVKMFGAMSGSALNPYSTHRLPHSRGGRAPSARNMIVQKIMRERGLSLPMASKYVKEHGLY
jgi:hypothetical protein